MWGLAAAEVTTVMTLLLLFLALSILALLMRMTITNFDIQVHEKLFLRCWRLTDKLVLSQHRVLP